jgi:hypothetical protein
MRKHRKQVQRKVGFPIKQKAIFLRLMDQLN